MLPPIPCRDRFGRGEKEVSPLHQRRREHRRVVDMEGKNTKCARTKTIPTFFQKNVIHNNLPPSGPLHFLHTHTGLSHTSISQTMQGGPPEQQCSHPFPSSRYSSGKRAGGGAPTPHKLLFPVIKPMLAHIRTEYV